MNRTESIMELLQLLRTILDYDDTLLFIPRSPSSKQSQKEMQQIRNKLELMGVRDIQMHCNRGVEANYRTAQPAQQKTLDAIMNAQARFEALKTLYYNGGLQLSPAEQKYFRALTAQRNAMRTAAAVAQKTK